MTIISIKGGIKVDISGIRSMLGLQQEMATSQTQKTGEDFQDILNSAIASEDENELKEACDGLESYMLSMVMKQVKKSMLQEDEDALIPEGDYTKTFEETMINTLADEIVKTGGIGLSEQLYKQIKNTYAASMPVKDENTSVNGARHINSEV